MIPCNGFETSRGYGRIALWSTASAIALTLSTGAVAQDAPEQEDSSPVIVVTGTRIEGVAAVGSAVISVGPDDVKAAGVSNSSDLLFKVPQIASFNSEGRSGGPSLGGSALNVTYANSPDLRGLGAASTLSLVNNHRMPPMSSNLNIFDSEAVPVIALERIEVIADGASAIYGSDAVAGVINYIMRKPFDGAEVSGRIGFHDDSMNYRYSGIVGKTWETGGIMLAAERAHRDNLPASARPDLYNDDFSAFGGARSPNQSFPGNVTIGGKVYPVPTSNTGALTFAELGPVGTINTTSAWYGADAFPMADVESYVGVFEQDLFDGVQFFADGLYSNRDVAIRLPRGGMSMTVPHTNPYSPCNPANAGANPQGVVCSGTSSTVTYNYAADWEPLRDGYDRVYNVTSGLRIDLSKDWKAEVYASFGGSIGRSNNFILNTPRLNAALAGNGTATGSSVPGLPAFNPFCGTAGCNNSGTLEYIGAQNNNGHNFKRRMFSANINGPLSFLELPGGPVRIAVGAEYYRDFFENIVNRNDRTLDGVWVSSNAVSPIRKVFSGFGEIYVPLADTLELTFAGRLESYNDVGDAFNPKFGFNWKPLDGLTFRGSAGTSFHAPSIGDLNPANTVGLQGRSLSGSSITVPGYTGPGGTVVIAAPIGGNSVLVPETATTYTFGFDYQPEWAPGLEIGATYYNIEYNNRVSTQSYDVGPAVALNEAVYAPFVIKNPRFWSDSTVTLAEFDQLLASLANPNIPVPTIAGAYSQYSSVPGRAATGGANDPLQAIAIIDGRRNNTGTIKTSGIDFTVFYRKETNWGSWRVGGVGSWVWNFDQSPVPGAPAEALAGRFTGPLKLSGRGQIGFDWGGLSATLFANYKSAYDIDRKYIPPAAPNQYLSVDSYTTVDLTVSYDTEELGGILNDITLTFGVQNVFDAKPPLALINTAPAVQFNPTFSSALGREVSFMISKKF